MFRHTKRLQFEARPERPDALYARKLQAVKDPVMAAVIGGMDPQQAIVGGGGAMPNDSQGVPWNGRHIIASGNLLADFRAQCRSGGARPAADLQAVQLDRRPRREVDAALQPGPRHRRSDRGSGDRTASRPRAVRHLLGHAGRQGNDEVQDAGGGQEHHGVAVGTTGHRGVRR
jgi:hypothetical protein